MQVEATQAPAQEIQEAIATAQAIEGYENGVRPAKGRNLAIAEWPTDETLPGDPWGEYRVPFVFATNGRAYLAQLETKSGMLKDLEDSDTERETKVHIATVQSLVEQLLYPAENAAGETQTLSADQYDCIVVDECHRGYLFDRELSDTELSFRDFGDYVSKYRAVLEYFDAVKIGLTATPALHTAEIFGTPVFSYSYREAVIDGFLIDHEPPIRPVTALAEEGIIWQVGEDVEYFDPKTGQINLAQAPDEIKVDVAQFNRKVITPEFNRVVCDFLADEIDPEMGKTLIFCVNNDHADLVTNLLKKSAVTECWCLTMLMSCAEWSRALAWREKTNEDIASIIGYMRQAALGDAPVPSDERVRRAMKKILASQR